MNRIAGAGMVQFAGDTVKRNAFAALLDGPRRPKPAEPKPAADAAAVP